MEVLLGAITSVLYGVADFIGGEASRRVSSATVVVWAGILSFPLLVTVALIVGGDASASDYWLGLAAGVAGAVGLVMLFAGLAKGRAAAVAPISAALGAIVPVVAAVASGDRPSAQSWIGVALAIPAISLSAWTDDGSGPRRAGLAYGIAAGIGFGGFAAIIGLTSDGSKLLPLIAARGGLVVVVAVLAGLGLWELRRFTATPRRLVAANAVLDVSANVTLLVALRAGSFALAAVAASFYPAVTVILARLVNAESLRGRQIAGIALTIVALALIASG